MSRGSLFLRWAFEVGFASLFVACSSLNLLLPNFNVRRH